MSGMHPQDSLPPDVPPEIPPPHEPQRPWPPRPTPGRPIVPHWEEVDLPDLVAERLLAERIIHLGGHLNTALANRGTALLLLLNRDSEDRPIELHLSCRDSELDAALALAGTVEIVAAPVHAIVHGTLHGPAIAALCAATERGAHNGAVLVLSLPHATAEGTAGQLAIQAEHHERQVARLRDLVAEATGWDADWVAAELRSGRVLTAEEALHYGLINRLL
ncbi:MAG: ATP-dependent Clp protease proteolytic subunit [Nocardioidaceae bacterium]